MRLVCDKYTMGAYFKTFSQCAFMLEEQGLWGRGSCVKIQKMLDFLYGRATIDYG